VKLSLNLTMDGLIQALRWREIDLRERSTKPLLSRKNSDTEALAKRENGDEQ
jgi:hypothetical protein